MGKRAGNERERKGKTGKDRAGGGWENGQGTSRKGKEKRVGNGAQNGRCPVMEVLIHAAMLKFTTMRWMGRRAGNEQDGVVRTGRKWKRKRAGNEHRGGGGRLAC